MKEPVLPEDPDSGDQTPLYNAYSGDGNVTGEVVYVNYGMPADYDKLKELGVDVKGKIVIARYGAGWRGIKPKVAYEHGAIGCLIYSDPRDDGYYAGDVYPGRPVSARVRRAARQRHGHAGPRRRSADAGLGQRAGRQEEPHRRFADDPEDSGAADFVRRCAADPPAAEGPVVPNEWRGALPFTYHVGPGPAQVHMKLRFEWKNRPLYNVDRRAFPGRRDPTSGSSSAITTMRG